MVVGLQRESGLDRGIRYKSGDLGLRDCDLV